MFFFTTSVARTSSR